MTQTVPTNVLHMAIEMSNKTWKLGFEAGGRRRFMDVEARDLQALDNAIVLTKAKFKLVADTKVVSCYEAGRDGFWLHRALLARGIENFVVDPASIEVDRRARRKKTDTIDVKKLLKQLLRHTRGEKDGWSIVRVPTVEAEDARRDTRERDRLLKERTQHTNRIRSLLILQGVDLKVTKDLPAHLEEIRLWDGSALPPRLKEELLREHTRWLLVEQQVKRIVLARRQALEAAAAAENPERDNKQLSKVNRLKSLRGIGEECAWKFVHEFLWRDFNNRREVGAAAGLTGTPFTSGDDKDRELGISKAGNRPVRGLSVEVGWLWLRYQPNSELSLWFTRRFASGGKRLRKIGIVALARRLVIDLWRFAEFGVVPAGAIVA